jgi:hypothetical protein
MRKVFPSLATRVKRDNLEPVSIPQGKILTDDNVMPNDGLAE